MPSHIRADGRVNLGFAAGPRGTHVRDLGEGGGFRVKFPRVDLGTPAQAVVINTAGGMTGGDRLNLTVDVAGDAHALVTSQSSEKVYRSDGADTAVNARLTVGDGGGLVWAPQPTILFNGARLSRRLEADVSGAGSLLMAETVIFGRHAMGERLTGGSFSDRWRVRVDGRLVMAENLRLEGDIAGALDRPAVGRMAGGGGAKAAACVLWLAPGVDGRLEALRERLTSPLGGEAGLGILSGALIGRAVGADPAQVWAWVATLVGLITGQPAPRVWGC